MQQTADIEHEQPHTGKKPKQPAGVPESLPGMHRPDPGRENFTRSKPGRIAHLFDLPTPAIHPDGCIRMSLIDFEALAQVDTVYASIAGRRGNAS